MSSIRRGALSLAIALTSAGCGAPRPSGSVEAKGPSSEFDRIVLEHSDAVARFPDGPGSRALYEQLLQAAAGRFPGEDSFARVVEHFKDDPFGARLVRFRHAELIEESSGAASRFVEALAGDGNAQTNAAALQLLLRQLANDDAGSFETCAGRFVGEGGSGLMQRMALYERMRFRADARPKDAALDALLFAARYPEAVENMRLRPYLAARLDSAGFALESALIEHASLDARAAQFLYSSLAEAASGPDALARAYFNEAPERHAIEQAVSDGVSGAPFELALHEMRAAFLHRAAGDVSGMERSLGRCVEQVRPASESFNEGQLHFTGELFRAVYGPVSTTLLGAAPLPGATSHQLLEDLLECRMTVAVFAADREGAGHASTIGPIVTEYVLGLGALKNWNAVIGAYDSFIARSPKSRESADLMAARARVLWKNMGDWEAAFKGYGQAAALTGESRVAAQCVLNQALIRVEEERYDDAYDLCQELLLTKPPGEIAGSAEYILALCEAGLGYADEGRARMARVAESFAGSPSGERALYWLGMSAARDLDYARAESRLAEYIERYPAGAEVGSAKRALAEIAALDRASK